MKNDNNLNDIDLTDQELTTFLENKSYEQNPIVQENAKTFLSYQGYDKLYGLDVSEPLEERKYDHEQISSEMMNSLSPNTSPGIGQTFISVNHGIARTLDNLDAQLEDHSEVKNILIEVANQSLIEAIASNTTEMSHNDSRNDLLQINPKQRLIICFSAYLNNQNDNI
ncbi:UNKNOWN [Stylonychia lemnae]|uniref:Uncharacterized protein n=1 Tax=Stylonychia lemnae TaxID=5949 RepID=A0A078BAD8_STYLE|nr:UNKNOWN [Stylonychia lemnae]|eukprot:CDW91196.1 UNKNOWN [Stylonychia lemnae]